MRTRLLVIIGTAFVAGGAFAAASGQGAQKAAAASMVVYKSAT
jgi:hypothetical protein